MMCLVLAMSGTSALLGWIDRQSRPADRQSRLANSPRTPGTHALSPQPTESSAQSVVAEAGDLRPTRWESVDVLADPAGDKPTVSAYPTTTFLAAKPKRKQAVPVPTRPRTPEEGFARRQPVVTPNEAAPDRAGKPVLPTRK